MSTQAMSKVIADYFKTQPVLKAWLFGSYARGEETPISDVDILVQFDEEGISLLKHAAMICELEEILNRPVDIVQTRRLQSHQPFQWMVTATDEMAEDVKRHVFCWVLKKKEIHKKYCNDGTGHSY